MHDTFLVKTVFVDEGIPHKLHVGEDGKADIDCVDRIGKEEAPHAWTCYSWTDRKRRPPSCRRRKG